MSLGVYVKRYDPRLIPAQAEKSAEDGLCSFQAYVADSVTEIFKENPEKKSQTLPQTVTQPSELSEVQWLASLFSPQDSSTKLNQNTDLTLESSSEITTLTSTNPAGVNEIDKQNVEESVSERLARFGCLLPFPLNEQHLSTKLEFCKLEELDDTEWREFRRHLTLRYKSCRKAAHKNRMKATNRNKAIIK